MTQSVCLCCKQKFSYEKTGRGRLRRYCSDTCRQRAPYRRLSPEERAEHNTRKCKRRLSCADCEKPMFHTATSLPQGEARCQPCRRVAAQAKSEIVRQPALWDCQDCGVQVRASGRQYSPGKYCKPCGRERQRMRDSAGGFRKRARKYGVAYEWIDVQTIYERDGWRCGLCGKRVNKNLKHPHPMSVSLDHILPMVLGGSHAPVNVQCSHLRCNLTKSYRSAGDQLALIG